MTNRYKIIIIISLLLCRISADPEKQFFEKISLEEGLSQSVVLDLAQDAEGFLWIGTEEGLDKYDGYTFQEYRHDEHNSNSLSDDYIRAIIPDINDNSLWIATNGGGLNHLDLKSQKFTRFKNNKDNLNSIVSNDISTLARDSSGNIWIGTYSEGLDKLDPRKKEFTHVIYESLVVNNIVSQKITQLLYDEGRNVLWIGTYDGLFSLDLETGTFTNLNDKLFKKNTSNNKMIRSFLLDQEGNLWVGTDVNGLYKIIFHSVESTKQKEIRNFKHHPENYSSISGNSINSILQTSKGTIWVGVWGGGICRVEENVSTGKTIFYTVRHCYDDASSLSSDDIIVLLEDSFGVMWVGTYGDGLNKLTPNAENFLHYSSDFKQKNESPNNRVFALYQDSRDYLWVGTWGGLNRINKKSGEVETFRHNKNQPNSIGDNRITSVGEDIFGNIWAGTLEQGANRFNRDTGKFTKYIYSASDKRSISGNRVLTLMPRSNGNVWMGVYNQGVCIYNHQTDDFVPLLKDNNELTDENVRSMLEDSRGNIWLGTFNGVNRYSVSEKKLKKICVDEKDNLPILNSGIVDMVEDQESNIWIGTHGGGLSKLIYNEETDLYEVKEFHVEDGLPSEYIYTVIPDKWGNLWMSTMDGIVSFNIETNHFQVYGEYEGLRFKEFREGAWYNSKEDRMYMGSLDGFVEFSPSGLNLIYSKSNMVITDFRIMDRTVNSDKKAAILKEANSTGEVRLDYNQNSIVIGFVGVNFVAPNSLEYNYLLDGFDKNYKPASEAGRNATYTNLPPGRYSFNVTASVSSNSSITATKTFDIFISPPFWSTWWFRVIALLMTGLLVFTIYRWRTLRIRIRNVELKREVKQRTRELEEINSAKDRFFSVIAHDLKGPFSYLLNTSELLAKEGDQLSIEDQKSMAGNINASANNLYNLLENLLDWSKYQMLGLQVNKKLLNVSDLLSNNLALLGQLACNKKIALKTNIEEEVIVETDEQILNTVVRNLLTNAIKFTREGGRIDISLNLKNDNVVIGVCDNGIGMDKRTIEKVFNSESVISSEGTGKEKGTGLGLILIKEFIEALGGKLIIESELGEGTKVYCSLPK